MGWVGCWVGGRWVVFAKIKDRQGQSKMGEISKIESELIQDGAYDNQECLKAKDDNANNQMTLKAGVTRQSSLPAKLHQTNQVMTLPLQRIHIPKLSINKSKSLIDTIPGGLKL